MFVYCGVPPLLSLNLKLTQLFQFSFILIQMPTIHYTISATLLREPYVYMRVSRVYNDRKSMTKKNRITRFDILL